VRFEEGDAEALRSAVFRRSRQRIWHA
jgi:hypothetical protein